MNYMYNYCYSWGLGYVPLSAPGTPDATAAAETSDQHNKQNADHSNDNDNGERIDWK